MDKAMLKTLTTTLRKARRVLQGVAMVAMSLVATPSLAGDYSYGYGSKNYGSNVFSNSYRQQYNTYNGGYSGYNRNAHFHDGYYGSGYGGSSSGGRQYLSYRYRDGGGSGYSFLRWMGGTYSNNMYPGPSTSINRPHRADWYAKLRAQRNWDNAQLKRLSASTGSNACGYTTSPAYCYRLQGPYPTQWKIVRY